MDWGGLLNGLFIAITAAVVALVGNYLLQNKARKETYREIVFEKTQEVYCELADKVTDLSKVYWLSFDLKQRTTAIQNLTDMFSMITLYGNSSIRNMTMELLNLARKDDFNPDKNEILDLSAKIVNKIKQNLFIKELLHDDEMIKIIMYK